VLTCIADLLPHLNFDIEQCMDYARQVNPKIHILQISATTGEGMDKWYMWLKAHPNQMLQDKQDYPHFQ
jgi:Ni2+-binding GTPase involved in maturation of urease and hydrogenase